MAIDLKTGTFQPEYAGKINFYLSALDDLVKDNTDQASIGIILCKEKDTFTAKYASKTSINLLGYPLTKRVMRYLKTLNLSCQVLKT